MTLLLQVPALAFGDLNQAEQGNISESRGRYGSPIRVPSMAQLSCSPTTDPKQPPPVFQQRSRTRQRIVMKVVGYSLIAAGAALIANASEYHEGRIKPGTAVVVTGVVLA